MKHFVGYNSQRNNFSFAGKFRSYWQCFTTSSWMLMSFYSSGIEATDDENLSCYLDEVEIGIGKPGIAEKIVKKLNMKIKTGSSYWWVVQKAGIEKTLWNKGVEGECIFSDRRFTIDKLPELVREGPVILATKKMGGLRGGHIILVVGYENGYYICHDPFGNALSKKYSDHNGKNVLYYEDFLKKYVGEKIRYIAWRKK